MLAFLKSYNIILGDFTAKGFAFQGQENSIYFEYFYLERQTMEGDL